MKIPSITSSIKYPYQEEFKEDYEKYFICDDLFEVGRDKMLLAMLKSNKNYFVLSKNHSKTGRTIIFKFKIIVHDDTLTYDFNPILHVYEFEQSYEI